MCALKYIYIQGWEGLASPWLSGRKCVLGSSVDDCSIEEWNGPNIKRRITADVVHVDEGHGALLQRFHEFLHPFRAS